MGVGYLKSLGGDPHPNPLFAKVPTALPPMCPKMCPNTKPSPLERACKSLIYNNGGRGTRRAADRQAERASAAADAKLNPHAVSRGGFQDRCLTSLALTRKSACLKQLRRSRSPVPTFHRQTVAGFCGRMYAKAVLSTRQREFAVRRSFKMPRGRRRANATTAGERYSIASGSRLSTEWRYPGQLLQPSHSPTFPALL